METCWIPDVSLFVVPALGERDIDVTFVYTMLACVPLSVWIVGTRTYYHTCINGFQKNILIQQFSLLRISAICNFHSKVKVTQTRHVPGQPSSSTPFPNDKF